MDFDTAEPETEPGIASVATAGVLVPGGDIEVTTTSGTVYYTYTPAEDGTYRVYSYFDNEDYLDTYVTVYDGDPELDETSEVAYDDQSGGNGHFKLTLNLDAGKTYYFGLKEYEDNVITFNVHFEEVQMITVTYDADAEQGGYLSTRWDDEQDIEVKDAVTTRNICSGDTFNTLSVYNDDPLTQFEGWFDEDGNKLDSSTVVTESMNVTAHWKKTEIIVLTAGVEKAISEADSVNYFRFTVPEDGHYQISFNGTDEDTDFYIVRYDQDYYQWGSCTGWGTAKWLLKDLTRDTVLLFRFGKDYNVNNPVSGTALIQKVIPVTFNLNNSNVYYEGSWNEETGDYEQLQEQTSYFEEGSTISRYSFNDYYTKDTNKKTFMGWSTNPNASEPESSITVTAKTTLYGVWKTRYTVTYDANGGWIYEDETSTTNTFLEGEAFRFVSVSNSDEFMAFEGWFDAKEGGTKYDSSSVVEKDVTLFAHWRKLTETTLVSESIVTAASDIRKVLYQFTPSEDGLYVFNSADAKQYYPTVTLYDSAKKEIASNRRSSYNGNFLLVNELKKGQTYYYVVNNEKDGTFHYPLKISKTAEAAVTFDANRDDAVMYASKTRTWDSKAAVGYRMNMDDVKAATTPEKQLRLAGWSKDPNATSPDSDLTIQKDTTFYGVWKESVQVTFHTNNDQASFEDFELDDEKVVTTGRNYDLGENLLEYDTPDIHNASGKRFIGWSVKQDSVSGDSEIIVTGAMDVYCVWAEAPAASGKEDAAVIAVGETKDVVSSSNIYWCRFTPEEDGMYALESSELRNIDPYVRLYDVNDTELAYDDDSGEGLNFLLAKELKAGKAYYYRVSCWSSAETGFQVTLSRLGLATITLDVNRTDGKAWFGNNETAKTATMYTGTYLSADMSWKDDISFLGWSEDPAATTGSSSLRITGDKKYYAIWADSVRVTFDVNRKDAWYNVWDDVLETDVKKQTMQSIYRKGNKLSRYSDEPTTDNPEIVFLGWSVSKNATEPDEEIILDQSEMTVYGVWRNRAYITFDANGGYFENVGTIYTQSYDDAEEYLYYDYRYTPKHANEKRLFAGWAKTPGGELLDEETTRVKDCDVLYAVWKEGILITLNANTGENPQGYFYEDGRKVDTVTRYVLPGSALSSVYYTASSDNAYLEDWGWRAASADGERLSGDTVLNSGDVLYVHWTELVDVTFDAGAGTINGKATNTERWAKGEKRSISKSFQASSGDSSKAFVGWSSDGTVAGIVWTLSPVAATTLKAVYLARPEVTIAGTDGSMGYAYVRVNGKYYYSDDGAFTFIWGQGTPKSEMYMVGDTYQNGKIFVGFSTTEDGKNLISDIYYPVAATMLYPVFADGWRAEFYANGGSFASRPQDTSASGYLSVSVKKGDKIGTVETPVNEGKAFIGWRIRGTDTVVDLATYTLTANAVFEAVWSEKLIDIGEAVIANISSRVYNGSEQKPKPEVRLNGVVLTEGTDYEMAYTNNKNAGTATITYTGKGFYEGTVSKNFTINKKASKVTLQAKSANYTGTTISIGKVAVKGSSGKVTTTYYSNATCTKKATPVNAGTYYVKATVAADANYNAATSSAVKLTIKKIANPIKASGKKVTLKAANVKKKNQTIKKAKAFTISKAQGTVTFKKTSGNKNITVDAKTGNLTVKKGLGKDLERAPTR